MLFKNFPQVYEQHNDDGCLLILANKAPRQPSVLIAHHRDLAENHRLRFVAAISLMVPFSLITRGVPERLAFSTASASAS